MWRALSKVGIVGPYCFEDERGQTVTYSDFRAICDYVSVIFYSIFGGNEWDVSNVWFQQDGATAHTANLTKANPI